MSLLLSVVAFVATLVGLLTDAAAAHIVAAAVDALDVLLLISRSRCLRGGRRGTVPGSTIRYPSSDSPSAFAAENLDYAPGERGRRQSKDGPRADQSIWSWIAAPAAQPPAPVDVHRGRRGGLAPEARPRAHRRGAEAGLRQYPGDLSEPSRSRDDRQS